MTNEEVELVRFHAQSILDILPSPTNGDHVITTPEEFDAALESANDGDTITLSDSFIYPNLLQLSKGVIIRGESYTGGEGRITRDEPAPLFSKGIQALADNHMLLGIAMQGTDNVGTLGGNHVGWDHCRILGDPTQGAHRGIYWCGSDGRITNCYVDDIFRWGQDTQAICGWDCGPGLVIENSLLNAAGENVMFGGADSSSPDRIPRGISMKWCTLSKNPAWFDMGVQIKNALEFKCAADVLVEECVLEYAGFAEGQGGFLIVTTVRNQDGNAPWSNISNVVVRNCSGGHASGVCNILGTDNVHPSGTMNGFTLQDCHFTDIDGSRGGSGRVFQFDGAPVNVKLDGIHVEGANLNQHGYFSGPPPINLQLTRMNLPPSVYGWYIDADGSGPNALKEYAPDIILDETIV